MNRIEPLLEKQYVTTEQVDEARTKARIADHVYGSGSHGRNRAIESVGSQAFVIAGVDHRARAHRAEAKGPLFAGVEAGTPIQLREVDLKDQEAALPCDPIRKNPTFLPERLDRNEDGGR